MTAQQKSKMRMVAFWVSFTYVLIFTAVAFGFHLASFDVMTFWPIFSATIGYITSLGVASYLTTPKDT